MGMLTYCGLLDDFALRHGDVTIRSLHQLNEHLIAAALFGERLLINDGYILIHPALREAVLTVDGSPLRHLVENGFVKLLTRNEGNLEGLADEMAQRGITSAQQLIAQSWYVQTYKPALEEWSPRLRSAAFDGFMNWPNVRIDDIFKSVAGTAYSSLFAVESKHQRELGRFRDNLDRTAARRTEWEQEATKLLKTARISPTVYRKLMLTASEAYHYSWGCALGSSVCPVRVLTRFPKYLHDFDSSLGQLAGTTRPSVKVFVPNLSFAHQAIQNRWQLLAEMVLPGHEVNQLKRNFLTCLEEYYLAEGCEQKVQAAAMAYTSALSRHFGNPRVVPVVFDLGFLATSTVVGAADIIAVRAC
jgi:hypothetical protein